MIRSVATRKSLLAFAQSRAWMLDHARHRRRNDRAQVVTTGIAFRTWRSPGSAAKGSSSKRSKKALVDGRADVAVHP
jgi:porphobilinogen deaminase